MVCGTDTLTAFLGGSLLAVSYPTTSYGARPAPEGPCCTIHQSSLCRWLRSDSCVCPRVPISSPRTKVL